MNDESKLSLRVKLMGGPLDGKYAIAMKNEMQLHVHGHTYFRPDLDKREAIYVEPPAPPAELPEPQPARHTLGERDCVVIEYAGMATGEHVERVVRSTAGVFGIDPRRVLVLDGGARLSTLTKTVPLTEARIDEIARRADLTRDRAPEWFVEMVRTVEDEHGIK